MTIAMLLSGGVDSSVALRLLAEEGHTITAFYLKIWLEDDLAFLGDCPWEEDLDYARKVCAQIGVSLEILPLQREYRQQVVEHTLSELRAGRTPSPDILCNQRIKFGEFVHRIGPHFEKIASGHYAQVEERAGLHWLKRSPDPVKDQTYFLCRLSQEQLGKILFPVGHLTKSQVRELAAKYQLPTQNRKDSQGICFLGKISYPDFVRCHLGEKEGLIVEERSGRVLGKHSGYWFHTIGQRQGLGLSQGPWYVIRKDVGSNTLFVSHSAELSKKSLQNFQVKDTHWICGPPQNCVLQTKLRHTSNLENCTIQFLDSSGSRLKVCLENPDSGIAPGQSAIFYKGDYCLGGGIIDEPNPGSD
ncbi:MAG: tRNA 2-thiouridine(34) synthase MnmA [Candidatus Omnitrophica bacterium]|nr:tRNA 2-thiouridine(34) synthase MnmA [Candidatus Omnitrophota bacterium]